MDLSESKILKLLRAKTNRPMKFSELMHLLSVPENQRREFRAQLKEMAHEGSVVKLRGGRYGLPDEMNLIPGVLSGHPDGYGFVITEDDSEDIYIGRHKLGGAMHNDHVLVRVESHAQRFGRQEGRIVRILERRTPTLVGLFEALNRDGWVIPSEHKYFQDVFVPGKEKKGAKPGQLVSVEIITYPTKHHPPVGRVIKVLGDANDPEVELRSIIHKFGVRQDFSPKVQKQVQKINGNISDREKKQRRDLTGEMIFTIDGESAKDFDDAVSLETTENGYLLGVHIADVSHYVTENSPLDKEALERGTSIYYADGVIPMLPFALSNELCSLKPRQERLTLSASITFDKQGNVLDYEIFDSVIKSKFRFTYNQVAEMLESNSAEKKYTDALPVLRNMFELSQMLRKRRFQEGSVDFNIPEPDIVMNAKGQVENIVKAEHNVAHELIEEFMLAANRVVAEHLDKKNLPGIHRIHEPPDQDKLHKFQEFIKDIGFRLPNLRDVQSSHLQNLLTRARGHAEERTLNMLLLRSLKKAVYSEKDPGHFCPRVRALHAFHLAHPPLPGPGDAPDGQNLSHQKESHPAGSEKTSAAVAEPGRTIQHEGDQGGGGGTGSRQPAAGAVHGRQGGKRIFRPHFIGHRFRTVCGTGRGVCRRLDSHLQPGGRLLRVLRTRAHAERPAQVQNLPDRRRPASARHPRRHLQKTDRPFSCI